MHFDDDRGPRRQKHKAAPPPMQLDLIEQLDADYDGLEEVEPMSENDKAVDAAKAFEDLRAATLETRKHTKAIAEATQKSLNRVFESTKAKLSDATNDAVNEAVHTVQTRAEEVCKTQTALVTLITNLKDDLSSYRWASRRNLIFGGLLLFLVGFIMGLPVGNIMGFMSEATSSSIYCRAMGGQFGISDTGLSYCAFWH